MRYCVDPQASRFTVQAFAGGPLSAVGHNPTFAIRDFRGEVEFDPKEPSAGSLRMVIAAASLALTNSVSDKDRQEIERTTQKQVLESDRFPEITYDCAASRITAIGPMQLALAGDLTLTWGHPAADGVRARLPDGRDPARPGRGHHPADRVRHPRR